MAAPSSEASPLGLVPRRLPLTSPGARQPRRGSPAASSAEPFPVSRPQLYPMFPQSPGLVCEICPAPRTAKGQVPFLGTICPHRDL